MKSSALRVPIFFLAILIGSPLAAEAKTPAEAHNGMVVTAQHIASDVGVEILKEGGNAVDAAVAVGYAEAVVNPCCGNIGGGGFMLLHLAGKRDIAINFRETAPAEASAAMYLDASGNPIPGASLFGYKAVGVPGTVAGLDYALKAYGQLNRAKVMAPAIRLAREGFVLTEGDAAIFDASADQFRRDPDLTRIYLRPDGSPLRSGDKLVQKDLAHTLTEIAAHGPDYFYRGPIAAAIVAASGRKDGLLTKADFANFHAVEAEPLRCTYRGYEFTVVPPPSSGGVSLCELLNILEGYDLKALGYHSATETRVLIEATRQAYADRNDSLGDPAFVDNPVAKLTSKDYAATVRAKIDAGTKTRAPAAAYAEKPQTTHYSIIDKNGAAASVTYTLNGLFGAMAMAPGTGVLLNDEMDDFTTKPGVPNQFGLVQGSKNAIAPGKRPLSSMSPTIVTKNGKPFLVLGSPGGARIITATLEAAINVIGCLAAGGICLRVGRDRRGLYDRAQPHPPRHRHAAAGGPCRQRRRHRDCRLSHLSGHGRAAARAHLLAARRPGRRDLGPDLAGPAADDRECRGFRCFGAQLRPSGTGRSLRQHLGLNVETVRRLTVLLAALGVGATVALCGIIGFVGLVAPHLVRLLGGPAHRYVLGGSALMGGVLVVLADLVARIIVAPAELPIGVLTSALGAPFFIWLLRRRMSALT